MSGDVVNLGRARKAQARGERDGQAAANRLAFGRTGAQKKAARALAERQERMLDGAKLSD